MSLNNCRLSVEKVHMNSISELKISQAVYATQALNPLGIGVATGEHCQNRVIFKQLLQSKAFNYCQTDACRIGGINELIAVYLMAAKFGGKHDHWLSIPF